MMNVPLSEDLPNTNTFLLTSCEEIGLGCRAPLSLLKKKVKTKAKWTASALRLKMKKMNPEFL